MVAFSSWSNHSLRQHRIAGVPIAPRSRPGNFDPTLVVLGDLLEREGKDVQGHALELADPGSALFGQLGRAGPDQQPAFGAELIAGCRLNGALTAIEIEPEIVAVVSENDVNRRIEDDLRTVGGRCAGTCSHQRLPNVVLAC